MQFISATIQHHFFKNTLAIVVTMCYNNITAIYCNEKEFINMNATAMKISTISQSTSAVVDSSSGEVIQSSETSSKTNIK